MMTITEALRSARRLNSDTADLDVQVLLCHVLKRERSYLYTWPEAELTEQQEAMFLRLIERRLDGEPVAHITGIREFWSLPLAVNDTTLIPRPDTETLVEAVLDRQNLSPRQILDLGTGTGAILLALLSERPGWHGTGADISGAAIQLAQENARSLEINRAQFLISDWFAGIPEHHKFDVIVSNPPYIDPNDRHLLQGDLRFEPRSALVARDQGYHDLYLIARQAIDHLQPGGMLALEHGFEQGKAVADFLTQQGYEKVQTVQDLAGNDRVTLGYAPHLKRQAEESDD